MTRVRKVIGCRPPSARCPARPTCLRRAMAQAKAAAGDLDVQVRGGSVAQQAIAAGVLDEVQIHLIPVLLGRGRRLFDVLPAEIELDIVRVIDTPAATHVRYRIRH